MRVLAAPDAPEDGKAPKARPAGGGISGPPDTGTVPRQLARPARAAVAGAAVLLTDRLAVTCAHVVEAALRCRRLDEAPKGAFPVDLPAFPRSRLTARVAPGGWFRDPPAGDLAVLTLDGALPAGAAPAPVGGGPVGDGASVLVYGHPATVLDGVWARARTVAAGGAHPGWLQLDGDGGRGACIERGFSGAGVWDEDQRQVIGVVASVLDGGGPVPTRVAWMIPLGLLAGTPFAPPPAGAAGPGSVDAWDLVDALMATGAAAAGARALLSVLPVGISGTVPRDDVPRLQLFHLVRRCGDFPDGPGELARAVRQLEGDTVPARDFARTARALWPDRLDGDA
ncbi:effector-associated domain 2-containing protein [Streptomyces cathayae]|uniref:Trypsin-like peptidase domain-containing protein n=1 Tax=Streptomyces cathayae TaxID=3031124 RepID=A0ABY8K4S6_9ACTN|nr:trypsin-like peptidase domain-containing protein [Streptomyces sp. HUAS 5]WGD43275.1 trypsin-like peptidase domain-containing protein [Streptomyces sp. HUAS 5]